MTFSDISDLIRRRRAVFPKTYTVGKPLDRTIIEQLLENANWAPTHRRTEPWRFKVFQSEASRRRLSAYLSEYYKDNTAPGEFSPERYAKQGENPLRAGAIIAICMQRDPEAKVPEWEELAAVACAVQNMWLSCTALNLGCYWSTPPAALHAEAFLNLQPGEKCYGLFYLGWHELPEMAGVRAPVGEKTVWMFEE
jgi:nitroreductase